MTLEITIAPPNSLLLLLGKESAKIPESIGQLIGATSSCIAVGTLSAVDGKTSVTLSDDVLPVQKVENLRNVFSGILETPRSVVEVYTVLGEAILTLPVPNHRSHVEIWANNETEPDQLYIFVL